jgi:hypothetical protein
MILPDDYVSKLTDPIIRKDTLGTDHEIETVGNSDNIWAYCWGTNRLPASRSKSTVFRAITKTAFDAAGGFDPSFGYFDGSV